MSIRRKRWFALLPLATAVTLGVGGLTGASAPPSACQAAEDWVSQHAGALPTNLAGFDSLPPILRRHVYAHLSSAARVRIWNEKLTSYAAANSNLSAAQRAFIRRAIDELPQLVSDSSGAAGRELVARSDFVAKASRLFSRREVADLFFALGSARASSAQLFGDCQCDDTGGGEECEGGLRCDPGFHFCHPVITGCGPFGTNACNGICD